MTGLRPLKTKKGDRMGVFTLEEYQEAQAQEAGTSSLGEQTYAGACATCHTQAGIGGAPGRIITP